MTVEITGVTAYTFEQFRESMNRSVALSAQLGLIKTEWHGTNYRASGPGVAAFGSYNDGKVRARIIISFPATLMRAMIVAEIERTMRDCGCRNLQST